MKLKNKKKIICIFFVIVILVLIIFKQNLLKNLPIYAIAGAVEDDELMVSHAVSLLEGKYLGEYSYNTLIKNNFFPIFLALIKLFNMSYLNSITLLYSIACIIFILSIKKIINKKSLLILIFILLLFNPIMFSHSVIQRVYRNAIIPSLSLIVIGTYIGLFLNINSKIKDIILFSIVASISLACFYYTREDSMWIIPYIIFMTIAMIISAIIDLKKNRDKNKISIFLSKLIIIVLPLIITNFFGMFFSFMNFKYYGTKDICMQNMYSKLLNKMYSIKPDIKVPRVSNTKEKLKRIEKVSPSFAEIKPELDKIMKSFENKNGEVENGLFMWTVITAIFNTGYDTPIKQQEIVDRISNEIQKAIDDGLLEEQQIMPILNCEMLDIEGFKQWFYAIIKTFLYIGNYNNINIMNNEKSTFWPGLDVNMEKFKYITSNRVLFEEGTKDINGNLLYELTTQDQYIKSIEINYKILEIIHRIYTNIAIFIETIGVFSYIIITVFVIINIIKKKFLMIKEWICISGIIGAIFTLILGVSYVDITQTNAIVPLYLSAAYPLFITFSIMCIITLTKIIVLKMKTKENINEENCNNR